MSVSKVLHKTELGVITTWLQQRQEAALGSLPAVPKNDYLAHRLRSQLLPPSMESQSERKEGSPQVDR